MLPWYCAILDRQRRRTNGVTQIYRPAFANIPQKEERGCIDFKQYSVFQPTSSQNLEVFFVLWIRSVYCFLPFMVFGLDNFPLNKLLLK